LLVVIPETPKAPKVTVCRITGWQAGLHSSSRSNVITVTIIITIMMMIIIILIFNTLDSKDSKG